MPSEDSLPVSDTRKQQHVWGVFFVVFCGVTQNSCFIPGVLFRLTTIITKIAQRNTLNRDFSLFLPFPPLFFLHDSFLKSQRDFGNFLLLSAPEKQPSDCFSIILSLCSFFLSHIRTLHMDSLHSQPIMIP